MRKLLENLFFMSKDRNDKSLEYVRVTYLSERSSNFKLIFFRRLPTCLPPSDYGRIYAVPLPSPEERGYPMIRRHFFYQRKLKANQTRKVGNDLFASWAASEKSTEEIPLKTCQIRLIFQKLRRATFKTSSSPSQSPIYHTISAAIYKLLLYKVHGAHKFAGAVLALILMTKGPLCLSASFKLTQIKQIFPRKCKIL